MDLRSARPYARHAGASPDCGTSSILVRALAGPLMLRDGNPDGMTVANAGMAAERSATR